MIATIPTSGLCRLILKGSNNGNEERHHPLEAHRRQQMDPKLAYRRALPPLGRRRLVFRYQTSPATPSRWASKHVPAGNEVRHHRRAGYGDSSLPAIPPGRARSIPIARSTRCCFRTCYASANAHKGKPDRCPDSEGDSPSVPTPPTVPQAPKDSFDVAVERYLAAIVKMRGTSS